jgi:hypothetical protein
VITVGLSASELSVTGLNGRRGLSEIPMSVASDTCLNLSLKRNFGKASKYLEKFEV